MPADPSFARWLVGLQSGDDEAANELWHRYFRRLVELARAKLPEFAKRDFDEEDVAISAFHSLCRGAQHGRFPELTDAGGLWGLLMVITARKASQRLRARGAAKRGASRVHGESVLANADNDEIATLDRIIGHQPTPEYAAQMAEESTRLLANLDDPSLREIALLRLEGYRNAEIATRLGYTHRTVERRLGLIRRLWTERADGDGEP